MPDKDKEYKMPENASPTELAGGRPIGPGETVKLNAKQIEENKELVDNVLIEIKKGGDK